MRTDICTLLLRQLAGGWIVQVTPEARRYPMGLYLTLNSRLSRSRIVVSIYQRLHTMALCLRS